MGYIEEAIAVFEEIVMEKQKITLDCLSRSTKGEIFVLRYLASHNSAACPSELGVAMRSTNGRISSVLGALEKKGQITRDIDKSNRRNILVSITETGRERARSETKNMHEHLAKVFLEMGASDTKEFVRILQRMVKIEKSLQPEESA
jgi:DNA-binding MarR family transcriptional regulator